MKGMVKKMSETKQAPNLKILHCGDVHLDTPFVGLTPEKSDERRLGLRNTFSKMMEYVRGAAVNYVIISGDLFDLDCATNGTAELLIREFRCCEDTKFIIAPGRSDFYTDNPIYTSGRLPQNCFVFSSSQLSRFDFDDDQITFYGWAFMDDALYESPLYDNAVVDSSRINIVCGYADVEGMVGSDKCPVSKSDIKKFGADYYAFGSKHAGGDVVNLLDSMYGYCGSLESIGFDDPGVGGAKLINVKYNGGALKISVNNMSFGQVFFRSETLDITGVDSNNEIINRVTKLMTEKKYGQDTALRLELTGYVDPSFIVPKNLGSDTFGLYFFELIDKTVPLYGTKHLRRDMSVKGEVFRQLLPMLESEDEVERLLGARAFREALAALEGREIDT